MRPLIPRQLNRAYLLIGWSLSIAALSIGVMMWRHFTSIVPPPPTGVFLSSMIWIFCGMIGLFYNARAGGLISTSKPATQDAMIESNEPVDAALLRLRELQHQLDQNLITLDEYKAQRREILDPFQARQVR